MIPLEFTYFTTKTGLKNTEKHPRLKHFLGLRKKHSHLKRTQLHQVLIKIW